MSFSVELLEGAREDLRRLHDFILERELSGEFGDVLLADRALEAIESGLRMLQTMPYTCRKVGRSPYVRELIIRFGHTGYVALFEIMGEHNVKVAAIRHQREDDYH